MKRTHDFLGEEVSGKRGDRVFVVPVPVERSTSYLTGTADAPRAILDASRQIELYNMDLDMDLEGSGIVTLDAGISSIESLTGALPAIREMTEGAFTCFIGGEHSITPAILKGMRYGEIGIVWLDAHADLRSEYLGDVESHACAAANSLEFGQLVEIGVRSLSKGEKDFMDGAGGVKIFRGWSDNAAAAVDALPDRVYISLDFDAIDPSLLRAVGTPEPGGLSWTDAMSVLDHVFENKTVVGMDAVELCPEGKDKASDFIAARIIYEAVSRFLSKEDNE